jgi:hypothetical protein
MLVDGSDKELKGRTDKRTLLDIFVNSCALRTFRGSALKTPSTWEAKDAV